MKTADSLENDVPLYAPCRKLTFNAPFGWLKKAGMISGVRLGTA